MVGREVFLAAMAEPSTRSTGVEQYHKVRGQHSAPKSDEGRKEGNPEASLSQPLPIVGSALEPGEA
ncbi:MAG TPA: hypothetical protein VE955_11765 [Candidatus Dormibacteraeota bacterium]|nr:hypothetical protein [Candidatus Dormibacteraeota bacterium]